MLQVALRSGLKSGEAHLREVAAFLLDKVGCLHPMLSHTSS